MNCKRQADNNGCFTAGMMFLLFPLFCPVLRAQKQTLHQPPEKTSFQIAAPWKADYDVRSDIAIVYGMNESFEERVAGYRKRGYTVHFMTGIAWGQYQDYFTGKFDGKTHWEEGQKQANGDTIWHGKYVPYIVPADSYITYMKSIIKRVIDAGVTSIYLEEPEFWARAGYSESFKKEWQKYYGFPWMAQHESPEATYLSSKLKYQLYFKALKQVFSYAKHYGESKSLHVRCYVPTHSLLNYSSWKIVSPEASLASLEGMDGYIAQVWTGTAREPNYYNGIKKERVFETAFMEYGSMLSMTAPTHRKMYFLTDPIEDWPRTWDDYKRNYQATFTAQLMYPTVQDYEVMPWPNRVYLGKFKLENNHTPQPISPQYATQMQVMVNALNDMPASANTISGSGGIGVLLSNSMMFQRFPLHKGYDDPQLSNFYGMVLPLLKRGVPVETVHMENLSFAQTLKGIKVLVMSYANMKPPSPEVHKYLAAWIRQGGILLYYGRDDDPFQQVKEWWNSNGNHYNSPAQHLFDQLNIRYAKDRVAYSCGKGKVYIVRQDPKELVLLPDQDESFVKLVQESYLKKNGTPLQFKNHFYLQRGPYDIASVLDESVSAAPLQLRGPVIDLFDPALPILHQKTVRPGEQAFLYNLSRASNKKQPKVLCAAARVYNEATTTGSYSFIMKSPSSTGNVMRILLPSAPKVFTVTAANGQPLDHETGWDNETHTCLLKFINDCDGVSVKINY